MSSSPVIEWRAQNAPNGVLAAVSLTGTGTGGAIPLGTNSSPVTVRVYNNFAQISGVADANNCVLAAYDDTVHQGQGTTTPVTGTYLQVQVLDYDGNTSGQDTQYYAIGGQTKHALPTNSGTIAGSGGGTSSHYIEVQMQVVIPSNAYAGQFSEGLWLEYSSTS